MRRFSAHMNPPVFFGAAGAVVFFCVVSGVWTGEAARAALGAQELVSSNFGWYYALLATGAVILCAGLCIGPWGRMRLGGQGALPEFSRLNWFAMLFAAGLPRR